MAFGIAGVYWADSIFFFDLGVNTLINWALDRQKLFTLLFIFFAQLCYFKGTLLWLFSKVPLQALFVLDGCDKFTFWSSKV